MAIIKIAVEAADMQFNKMEIDVIKYIGGPNHITILYRNSDSKKLFVFYCYTLNY